MNINKEYNNWLMTGMEPDCKVSYEHPEKLTFDEYNARRKLRLQELVAGFGKEGVELKVEQSGDPEIDLLRYDGVEIRVKYNSKHADDFENEQGGSGRILRRLQATDKVVLSSVEYWVSAEEESRKNVGLVKGVLHSVIVGDY